jgi:hypothetical protein
MEIGEVGQRDEIWAFLRYYTSSSGNTLPTFRDNVLVPSLGVKKSKKKRKPTRRYALYIGEGNVRSCRLPFLLGLHDP